MKILILTALDAASLAIENIVKEMVSRGHTVEVYSQTTDPQSIRMFTNQGLTVFSEKDLTPAKIQQFDVALCSIDAMHKLRLADIYIFSYNIEADTWVSEGADFLFTFVKDRHLRCFEDCATMPLGNAKNDIPKSNEPPKKQILFIDAGHNPFGMKGKLQVADMLLDICHSFPEYKLVVKPRWLLKETGNQTHRSTLHLYTLLSQITDNKLPDNLVLLNEHRNMQELIDESVSVVTTSISCYWDAALRDKGCIVVDGLDSEEQVETRAAFRNAYKDARRAGCCVNYDEVTKYLPLGLPCDPEYLHRRMPYKNGVSARAVDVIEYIYENFLKKGKFPAIRDYDYETFKDAMYADAENFLTFDQLKYKRFKNGALYGTRIFEQFKAQLDYSDYYKLIDESYQNYPLTEKGYQNFIRKMNDAQNKLFFANKNVLMKDPIDQSLLMQRLFDVGRENEILKIPAENVRCLSPYNYYLGMIYKKRGEIPDALAHFQSFLKEANVRTFSKYLQENDWGIRNAYNYVFEHFNGENIAPQEFVDLYIALYEQRQMTIIAYPNRKRAHNWLPKVAEQLSDTDPERALKCLQLYAKWEYHYNIRERNNQINVLQQNISALRSTKMYHAKQNAKWFIQKLKGGIRCVQEHGWRYTWNNALGKIHRKTEKVSIFRIWSKFRNGVMAGFSIYAKLVRQYGIDTIILLSAQATGDAYIFGQLVNAFIDKNAKGRQTVFCVYGKSSIDVAHLFRIKYVEPLSLNQFLNMFNLLMFVQPDLINALSMHYHIIYCHTKILAHLDGLHGFNIGTLPRAYLNLGDCDCEKPAFCRDQAYLDAIFNKLHLERGNTILLSPYAKSSRALPSSFWAELAQRLRQAGHIVCTNAVGKKELPVQGTIPVEIPYRYSVPFLEMAGACVSLRSGFCDVTNTAQCLKITLYPQNNFKHGAFADCNKVYSLKDIYGRPNQYEMIHSPETEEDLIDQIVTMIDQQLN